MKPGSYRKSGWLLAAIAGITMLTLLADSEAARLAGGGSIGSRGSRSFSPPQTSAPSLNKNPAARNMAQPTPAATATAAPAASRGGLLSGVGGFLAGGLLGGLLMGGLSGGLGGGSSVGMMDLILLGGGLWFFLRWMRRRNETSQPQTEGAAIHGDQYFTPGKDNMSREMADPTGAFPLPGSFPLPGDGVASNRLELSPDFNLDQEHFLKGAKIAFLRLQEAWGDHDLSRLQPLLTERMLAIVEQQLQQRQQLALKDRVEQVQIQDAAITEAWEEADVRWLTVRFVVSMVEYALDAVNRVVEGDAHNPVVIEEYWTFSQPVSVNDPHWRLSSIQQRGEIPASIA